MRQLRQPLAQQRVDLRRRQAVAELLQPLGIGAGANAVVESLEGDALLGQLPLDVFVAVDAKLGVVGEVGAELQEEGAEVVVEAVEVELVDHGRGRTIQGYFCPVQGSCASRCRKTDIFS